MNTCEPGYDFIEQLSTKEEQNILDIHLSTTFEWLASEF